MKNGKFEVVRIGGLTRGRGRTLAVMAGNMNAAELLSIGHRQLAEPDYKKRKFVK